LFCHIYTPFSKVISEKEYTRESNQLVVPPLGGSFKVQGYINN